MSSNIVDAINQLGYRVANAASTAYALDMLLEHCGSSDRVRQEARSVAEGMHHVLDDLANRIMDLAEDVHGDGVRAAEQIVAAEPVPPRKTKKRKAVRS